MSSAMSYNVASSAPFPFLSVLPIDCRIRISDFEPEARMRLSSRRKFTPVEKHAVRS
jgi:hypothetical protein